jgi:hypothetical protein
MGAYETSLPPTLAGPLGELAGQLIDYGIRLHAVGCNGHELPIRHCGRARREIYRRC